ncbi:methylation-associated defense system protein kinase MAD6 [Polyangium aurulentum]|uniref:methylation-associated defense system protein kinase MAD6 n=1 Tax=Polyangium aurulentum TaxID=2567896 RepID=UPI0010AE4B80|nr:protein kinase [Polyangium aurulentum]UQA57107.1 protein kinase [Polyangium aurulentum]
MAKVIPIGEPVNEAERQSIAYLRDHLPASYLVLHNFDVVRDGETFEVDIAVVAPHAVYLVDVKGTRGLIDVYGPKWYPEGRQPFNSPLAKLRAHAKSIKGVITASQPGRRDLEDIYVDAVIVLTAPDATIVDQGGRDAPNVTVLKKAAAFFQNSARIPAGKSKNISAHHNMVLKALQGVAKPRSGPARFGNWEVTEKLGGTDTYVEHRAFNIFAGQRSSVLLRVYQADPYKPAEEREAQRRLISNAYRALNSMPGHPSIVGVRDFFGTESEDKYVLVTEDVPGQALRVHIEKPILALTYDQKTRIAGDLLNALVHLQANKVVHRNICPSNILVGTDGRMRLTGFDFARAGGDRSRTIAHEIVDDLEPAYMAPEVYGEPSAASPSSDIFSTGLVLYELFTGERPFATPTALFDQGAVFAMKPTEHRPELPKGFDDWLQKLCTFDPNKRPSAAEALTELNVLLDPSAAEPNASPPPPPAPALQLNYFELPAQTQLTQKYVIEKRLGKPGSFGVVYKVIDTLGDVSRAMKLVLRDRHSTLERLKKEYKTLLRTPDHPNVVKVIDADLLPGNGPPFIVFEYVDGIDVGEMIEGNLFAPEDALELARQVVSGLVHLHATGVFHCDIKPRNLLWTDRGAKIIDFNVSVLAAGSNGHGGGSRRYLPPDLDLEAVPSQRDLADRDLYALGLTLYEAVTGRYPWETSVPPPGKPAGDPRELSNLGDIAPEFADVMLKSIAPKRADRFSSALELQNALANVPSARRAVPVVDVSSSWESAGIGPDGPTPPNTNPYVRHLLTVYSQSKRSNAGTRGLDVISEQTYVETALDRDLLPSVLASEFSLVIISGNAGDGKTAFLQKLEQRAEDERATFDRSLPNGVRFVLRGRTFLSNYDGSQDEGDQKNDDVLRAFLAPFAGDDAKSWSSHKETRLIAINEGRLVDFLEAHRAEFSALAALVKEGLQTGEPTQGIAVVNLNLRSVVTDPQGLDGSILERLVGRMTHEKFWTPCHACDLKDRCYAFHNAQTFQDETAGPRVVERLKSLYAVTHLRGRLHITLRDLRSALAFTLVGTRDCDEIHELYQAGRRDEIVQGFYFNSWKGGDALNADRLLTLLSEVDIAASDDPRLDRMLDFVSPEDDRSLFRFERRGNYDRDVLRRLHEELPRDFSGRPTTHRADAHRRFIAMARRRAFFERRDSAWRAMLPYKTADRLLAVVRGERDAEELLDPLLVAINRGEGLNRPERLGNNLALEVRRVDGGSVRSYRLYPRERFSLALNDQASRSRFVEHMPTGLVLRYQDNAGLVAELLVSLDVFEMLQRLNDGYRPSVEEEQGYYLSLAVFKNLLGSAPYQEVLLSTSGHDFYRVARQADGRLEMSRLKEGLA